METVGAIAAATLGYIHANTGGALMSYKAYKKFTKNKSDMAPTRLKKAKTAKVIKKIKEGSRRKARKVAGSRSRVYNQSKVQASIGQLATMAKHKKMKDKIKEKKRVKVKVPMKLRKQIKQVLDAGDVYGNITLQMHGSYANINTTDYTHQAVFALPLPRVSAVAAQGLLFDPYLLQYAAARLFNNRPTAGTGLTVRALSNLRITNGVGWKNFDDFADKAALKLTVQKLYAVITMKNNTSRTMYLKMFVCKPKYQRRSNVESVLSLRGLPVIDWINQLDMEGDAKISGGQSSGQASIASTININDSVKFHTYNNVPTKCQSWNRLWSVEQFNLTLEPGQVHKHTVQGDEIDVDFSKMFASEANQTVFNDVQKLNRYVFFTGVPELAWDNVCGAIRAQNSETPTGSDPPTNEQRQYLLFETEIHCKIKMPEPTGGSIPTPTPADGTARLFNNTNRKRAYCVDTFTEVGTLTNSGLEMNVDDNTTVLQTS